MAGLLGVNTVVGINMSPLYPRRLLLFSERIVVGLIKQSEISVYSLSFVSILTSSPKSSLFYIGEYISLLLFASPIEPMTRYNIDHIFLSHINTLDVRP